MNSDLYITMERLLNMIVDLDKEQSRIWNERKELILILPMQEQPEEIIIESEPRKHGGGVIGTPVFPTRKALSINKSKFKQGDKIQVRYVADRVIVDKPGHYAKMNNSKMTIETTVKEVLQPKRIQDLIFSERHFAGLNKAGQLKDWFNKKYSKPVPVECKCISHSKRIKENCFQCGGDGISHYICYAYDEELNHLAVYDDFSIDDGMSYYKGKDFKIIVNPFVELVKIVGDT